MEEIDEGALVDNCTGILVGPWVVFGGWVGGEEVDGAALGVEDFMGEVEFSATGDDAAEGLDLGFEFGGDGHGHLIGFEGATADEDGVGAFADFEEAVEVEFGGEVGGVFGTRGGFAIGGDGKVDEDSRAGHWRK